MREEKKKDLIKKYKNLIHHEIYKIKNNPKNIELSVDETFLKIEEIIETGMKRVNLNFTIIFYNPKINKKIPIGIELNAKDIITLNDLDNNFKIDIKSKLKARIEDMEGKDSGLIFKKVKICTIKTYKKKSLLGSSYIELPPKFNKMRSIINIKNEDNKCFIWSILAKLKYNEIEKHRNRVSKYEPYENEIIMKEISYSVQIKDISKIETMNKNLSINVFGFENNKIISYYISKELNRENIIDLLLYKNHYITILNLNSVLRTINKMSNIYHLCRNCLNSFKRVETLENHQELCYKNKACEIEMPNYDLKFINHCYKSELPFRIYADFESLNVKYDSCSNKPNNSFTEKITYQKPISVGIYIKSDYENIIKSKYFYYTGENVIKWFIEKIDELNKLFRFKIFKTNIPYNKDEEPKNKNCYYCEEELIEKDKVIDHNHYNGKIRGYSCSKCNLKEGQITKFVPIYFHNLSGYDAHLFIKELSKKQNQYNKLKILAKSSEEYISFTFGCLKFLDSNRFFLSTLDKVSKSLTDEQLEIMKIYFPKEEFQLIRKKGFYPYDWMDSENKLNNTELPNQKEFYNKLKDDNISDENYKHAKEVWEKFNCKTFLDYHELYLKTDVLLLSDCFENFRKFFIENHNIDPCHCYSTPGLTWQCGLKYTKCELELIKDYDMLLMIEKGIRGGFSGVLGKRFVEANNKYIRDKDYRILEKEEMLQLLKRTKDKKQVIFNDYLKSNYLMYLDANNLYGWSMSQLLPYNNFKWEEDNNYYLNIPKDRGCIIECDLEYTNECKNKTNKFPLAPTKRCINENELLKYQKTLLEENNEKLGKVEKLILDLKDKEKYVIHHRLIKFYESLGLKVTKVYRTISFIEKEWLKPYITFNTEQRMKAKTDFEKDIFKLLNNSFYGKTVENIRDRIEVEILNKEQENIIEKRISEPYFKDAIILENDELVLILKNVKKQTFNKPIYTGMTVLDLSKLLMYEYYYNTIENNFPDNEVIYMDTDSLIINFKSDDPNFDIYEEFNNKIKDSLDTSDYPKDHKLYSIKNKKVIGKFKDEMNGKIIKEVICLKSKQYSILLEEENIKKIKGLSKCITEKHITHSDFKNTLLKTLIYYSEMYTLNSVNHEIYLNKINKKSMTPFDDKRKIFKDGIKTKPYK